MNAILFCGFVCLPYLSTMKRHDWTELLIALSLFALWTIAWEVLQYIAA